MKKNKLLALLLVVVLVVGVVISLVPNVWAAEADEEGLVLDKTAEVDYTTGEGFVELSSYVKGSVTDMPTDVVLVIDQSGSMWTAVDPDNATSNLSELDTTKGVRRGYYVAFDLDTLNRETGAGQARLVRYKNGWQITEPFDATIYDEDGEFLGFVNTCSYDTEDEWKSIPDDANYVYAVSISGALYESLNIFMEEMKNAVNCRVAIVTFAGTIRGENKVIWEKNLSTNGSSLDRETDYQGSGIFIDGTLEWDGTAPGKLNYQGAFEDPTTVEGRNILSNTIEAINTDYGNTPTALGILYARRLFLQAGREDAQKVAIVFTDGIPAPAHLGTRVHENNCNHTLESYKSGNTYDADIVDCDYCDLVAARTQTESTGYAVRTTYADQAASLRKEGATVYSIGPKSGKAGTDVLEKIATEGQYYDASGDNIAEVFRDIAGFIVSSSQELNENTRVVDIMSDSFALPEGTDVNDIKVYTAAYMGEVNGVDTFSEDLVELEGAQIEVDVDEKKVEVWGFDYKTHAVGMTGSEPVGSKLVVRIPIVTEPGFLGGNDVTTNNKASGVYNGEVLINDFPVPIADVKVKEIVPEFKDSEIYVSQAAVVPHIANIGQYRDGDTIYVIDGINNAYVDIVYTISDGTKSFSYTVPAGTKESELKHLITSNWKDSEGNSITDEDIYKQLTEDTQYAVTCTVTSTGNDKNTEVYTANPVIRVYKPEITFQDSVMNLGETADYETENYVKIVWKHGNDVADVSLMGEAPRLQYEYSPAEGAFTQETAVQITSVISPFNTHGNHRVPENTEIIDYVTFYRDACSYDDCTHKMLDEVTRGEPNFVVHLNTFDLTISKTGAQAIDENQMFIFRITDSENNHVMDVTVVGNRSVTIKGLPAGVYTVTEITDWSWRYTPDDESKTASAADAINGVTTVSFANTRTEDQWLSGDNFWENIFNGLTPNPAPNATPTVPTE